MEKRQFLTVCFLLGVLIGVGIGVAEILASVSHTMQDIRSINSEMRDTLNCQTWEDDACAE